MKRCSLAHNLDVEPLHSCSDRGAANLLCQFSRFFDAFHAGLQRLVRVDAQDDGAEAKEAPGLAVDKLNFEYLVQSHGDGSLSPMLGSVRRYLADRVEK